MASEIGRILRWFYRKEFPQGILEFDELHIQASMGALGKSQQDSEAYLYANVKTHWGVLLERLGNDKEMGRSRLFNIEDATNRRVSWVPSNIGNLRSAREKHVAMRLNSRPHILRMIDALSDREYEALCCIISKFAGATNVKLTPKGNEGGIDFFALINYPGRCHVFSGNHKPIRIVGQAKKYSDRKVEVDEVKELTETIQEVKNRSPSVEHLVPPWFRKAWGPVAGWLVAHNGVQSGGMTKARNHGIIVSDSIDLAEIAALSCQNGDMKRDGEQVKILTTMVSEALCSE